MQCRWSGALSTGRKRRSTRIGPCSPHRLLIPFCLLLFRPFRLPPPPPSFQFSSLSGWCLESPCSTSVTRGERGYELEFRFCGRPTSSAGRVTDLSRPEGEWLPPGFPPRRPKKVAEAQRIRSAPFAVFRSSRVYEYTIFLSRINKPEASTIVILVVFHVFSECTLRHLPEVVRGLPNGPNLAACFLEGM